MISAMWGTFTGLALYAAAFLFVLAIVIFFHELGHFAVGRLCGVRVKTFALGFGPEVVGYTDRQGTRWRLSAIPLGGYVKFFGDQNAASVPDHAGAALMSEEERRVSFVHKSVLQRAAIVAAGPAANFLLAIVIFATAFLFEGRQVREPVIASVAEGTAAARAGFLAGDRVVAIDGARITSFEDMQRVVSTSGGTALRFEVARGGRDLVIGATPDQRELVTVVGKSRIGVLGVRASDDPASLRTERYGPLTSLDLAARETWFVVERTANYLVGLFAGRESADQMSGPLGIARVSGEVAKYGIGPLLSLAAILSISVGMINLVPVPLLDGGHLLFYALEALRGRPLSPRTQEVGFRIGFALVVMLMVFTTWNDMARELARFVGS